MSKIMPTRKVAVGALTGAAVTVIIWPVQAWGGVQVPAEVAAAITTLLSFAVSWLVPDEYEA